MPMQHTFNAVHEWTRKVVRGIHLVLGACGQMRLGFAAVNRGIAHGTVLALVVNFDTETTLQALWDHHPQPVRKTHIAVHLNDKHSRIFINVGTGCKHCQIVFINTSSSSTHREGHMDAYMLKYDLQVHRLHRNTSICQHTQALVHVYVNEHACECTDPDMYTNASSVHTHTYTRRAHNAQTSSVADFIACHRRMLSSTAASRRADGLKL